MAHDLADPPSGSLVRLRDVTPGEVDLLDALNRGREGGFNDLGPLQPVSPEAWLDGRMRGGGRGRFFISRVADGVTVGTIMWMPISYGPNPESKSWMLGIDIVPEGRGQGLGSEAQWLLAEWLFATTDANRVEASTDVENIAEQRSLEKAGFRREGVMRGAQFRAGAYHDLILYARLRDD